MRTSSPTRRGLPALLAAVVVLGQAPAATSFAASAAATSSSATPATACETATGAP